MNRYKNNSSFGSKSKSVIRIVVTVLIVAALMGGLVFLFRNYENKTTPTEPVEEKYNTVYLVPSDTWKEDNSSYGAWCWADTSEPAAKFILGSDEDNDGVVEFKIDKAYTMFLFVDLKPGTNQLGADWSNKREQTSDLNIPVDTNVYYHQAFNEWTSSKDAPYVVTTEPINISLFSFGAKTAYKFVYAFDKTGVKEAQFIEIQDGAGAYICEIPAGYTHVIFVGKDAPGAGWDNVLYQSSDLVLPTYTNVKFDFDTNEWIEMESVLDTD